MFEVLPARNHVARLKDSSLQCSVFIVAQQLRITSWQRGCVTKHPEFPNLALPLELLALSSLLFFPFLYNKGKQSKQSHLLMTPVLFLPSQDAAERTRPVASSEIWPCTVSGLNHSGWTRS